MKTEPNPYWVRPCLWLRGLDKNTLQTLYLSHFSKRVCNRCATERTPMLFKIVIPKTILWFWV